MRCFVAIYPDAGLLRELHTIQRRLRIQQPDMELRWLPRHALHLTLAFLANIDARQLASLHDVLQQRLPAFMPFRVKLTHIAPFPAAGPRVVAAMLEKTPALQRLHDCVLHAADQAGIALSSRPLAPHITLARVRGQASAHKRQQLKELAHIPVSGCLHVTCVRIVESKLSAEGAQHTTLNVLPLGKKAAN